MGARGAAAGPLGGLRVIELGHVVAGPVCGLLLADLGAEVVKVERPPRGDGQRWDVAAYDSLGPFSASFAALNRNKRSRVLDLASAEGRAALLELLEGADVLVHNYRAEVLERFGLGHETLRRRFPSLVYCTISGYGRSGPWADRGGFDLIAQAMSGIMSFTGPADSTEPVKCGVPLTDIGAGMLAAVGILAALQRRQRTGRGDHVDTSLLEAGVLFTCLQSAITLANGRVPEPLGTAHPLYAPYEAYRAADGWLALGTANDRNWERLTALVGAAELASDARFSSTAARIRNRRALTEALAAHLAEQPRDELLAKLAEARIPGGPVLSVPEMLAHPQVLARDMVVSLEHPAIGRYRTLGCPIKFAEAGAPPPRSAPLLDEH